LYVQVVRLPYQAASDGQFTGFAYYLDCQMSPQLGGGALYASTAPLGYAHDALDRHKKCLFRKILFRIQNKNKDRKCYYTKTFLTRGLIEKSWETAPIKIVFCIFVSYKYKTKNNV
jgi:hypothetical protein